MEQSVPKRRHLNSNAGESNKRKNTTERETANRGIGCWTGLRKRRKLLFSAKVINPKGPTR